MELNRETFREYSESVSQDNSEMFTVWIKSPYGLWLRKQPHQTAIEAVPASFALRVWRKFRPLSRVLSAWELLWRIEGSIDVSLMNYQGPSESLPGPLHRGFLHSSKTFCCHTPRRKRLWTFTCNVGRDAGKGTGGFHGKHLWITENQWLDG